jgi:chromodomain-helicase-DNA-binding protein 1
MAALPPSTSNPTSIPLHNGHLSPAQRDMMNGSHKTDESSRPDSRDSRVSQSGAHDFTDDATPHDMDTSDDAQDDDADADADADADGDYDIETPPQAPSSPSRSEQSLSEESVRPPKRKALHDEDFIMNNPELYGLRRSVCWIILI